MPPSATGRSGVERVTLRPAHMSCLDMPVDRNLLVAAIPSCSIAGAAMQEHRQGCGFLAWLLGEERRKNAR